MLFYLLSPGELAELFDRLGYPFDPERGVPRNVDYYLARTSEGSTLSGVVYSWVLARLARGRSWERLMASLEIDVADTQGGTTVRAPDRNTGSSLPAAGSHEAASLLHAIEGPSVGGPSALRRPECRAYVGCARR